MSTKDRTRGDGSPCCILIANDTALFQLVDRRLALPWYPQVKVFFHAVAFLLIASALTSTWCLASEPTKFPAFLTSWGLMLGTLTYLVQIVVTLRFSVGSIFSNLRIGIGIHHGESVHLLNKYANMNGMARL